MIKNDPIAERAGLWSSGDIQHSLKGKISMRSLACLQRSIPSFKTDSSAFEIARRHPRFDPQIEALKKQR
ncbi:hypothetical protein [Bradyrhizobium sp. STM 3557]|uniref:hypothetical protein n=1 Tax=Bradyrhizobium sp. STM 3557 TaxID=578920 RepID=UPI0038908232